MSNHSRKLYFWAVMLVVCCQFRAYGVTSSDREERVWAGTLASGAIRSEVWVTDTGVHDAQELFRQLDLEGEIRVMDSEQSDEEREDSQKDLAKIELLVCSDGAWAELSPEMRSEVHSRIREGMGLVFVALDHSIDSTSVTEDSEETPIPSELESRYSMPGVGEGSNGVGDWLTFTAGSGRIAFFQGSDRPVSQELVAFDAFPGIDSSLVYDYRLASLIRAAIWAAQRDTGFRISRIVQSKLNRPDELEIPPQLPREFTQSMLDGLMRTITQAAAIILDRQVPKEYDIAVRTRQPYRELSLSPLPSEHVKKGASEAVVHVPAGNGETWVDVWLLHDDKVMDWMSYEITIAEWPVLSEVKFSKQIVQPSDSVEVTFSVAKNSYRSVPAYAFLQVRDTYGRVLKTLRVTVDAEGGEVRAMINWSDALTQSLRLEVFLVDGNTPALTLWSKKYSSFAGTTLTVNQPEPRGLRWIVEGAALQERWLEARYRDLNFQGADSLSVPEFDLEGQGGAEANLSIISNLDLRAATDEFPDIASPAFRQSLYMAVEDWRGWSRVRGTKHVSFDLEDAFSLSDGKIMEGEHTISEWRNQLRLIYPGLEVLNKNWGTQYADWASVMPNLKPGNPVARADTRRAEHMLLLGLFGEIQDQLSSFAPTPGIGVEGIWDGLVPVSAWIPELTYVLGPPDPVLQEKIRSYRGERGVTGVQLDTLEVGEIPRAIWTALFHGTNRIFSGEVRQDSDDFEAIASELDSIRSGVDTMLQLAEPLPPSIAIYENSVSHFASNPAENEQRETTHAAVIQALESLGLSYSFRSYADLMDSGLTQFPVVLAPDVKALSQEERVLLREFAEGGGTLVADAYFGLLDEHGQAADQIARSELNAATANFAEPQALAAGLDSLADSLKLDRLYPDSLNGEIRNSVSEWFRYRFGKAELFAALKDSGAKKSALEIQIPDGMFAYDSISGTRLKSSKARVSWNDAGAALIAVLPYRVSRLILDAPEEVEAGHRLSFSIQVKTYEALPGDHVVHVTLLDQNHKVIQYYEMDVLCEDGSGEGYFPLAMNEMPGRYALIVRDVLSGAETTQRIEIHP
jgi:hypothetical protein